MFATSKLSLVSALALAATALAQTFSINTPPSLIQCQPAQVSWVGGTSPFIISVIPGGMTAAAAIEYISTSATTSPLTWTVNLASGTYLTLKITDSTGANAYSSPLTIQASPINSCLNATAATSGVVTSAVSTTVASVSSAGSSAAGGVSTSAAAVSSAASSAVTSASAAASSAVSAASSAASSAAATTSKASGAFENAVIGVPAVLLAVAGGLAALF